MPTFQEHCTDCITKFGRPYAHVHRWLDALQPKLGPQHRAVRHNAEGIEEVRKMWGDQAAEAAKAHIELDEGGFELKGGIWMREEKKNGPQGTDP